MKTLLKLVLLVIVLAIGAGIYIKDALDAPYPPQPSRVLLEIPRGLRAREVVGLLEQQNVIQNQYLALGYLFYTGQRQRLQAGEYLFDRPMTVREVLDKIANGAVYLRKFTVPEGLTITKTAQRWEDQGFGSAEEFRQAAAASVDLVHDIDPEVTSLEGFLFPETYSFPSRTTAAQAVEAMVRRLKSMLEQLEKELPVEEWPLPPRETVILASLIETEAAHDDERSTVSSVYMNRIERRMLLQCDPTVIYALEREGKYRGQLILADLKFDSPYNTYVYPGLPPGPIANPGYASLRAAVQPAASTFLYFVRTLEGRHTFSETLAEHNRAVAAYRLQQRRERAARPRPNL